MKILFIAANPTTDRLALDEELRAIERSISSARHREEVQLRAALAARIADLMIELNREKPDILHISSHGSEEDGLILVSNDGGPQTVSPEMFAEILSSLEKIPCIIIMNACFSFSQADKIKDIVDFVIGVPSVIEDKSAVLFSSLFYSALCEGCSFSKSFKQAVIAAKFDSKHYWGGG